ncbi:hypothetical protein BC831DRAFT_470491 [Entophlyctis helioformis]|nr:hypothetical protein BC831DRAFT_470491 [Entophlyctis helioformis]
MQVTATLLLLLSTIQLAFAIASDVENLLLLPAANSRYQALTGRGTYTYKCVLLPGNRTAWQGTEAKATLFRLETSRRVGSYFANLVANTHTFKYTADDSVALGRQIRTNVRYSGVTNLPWGLIDISEVWPTGNTNKFFDTKASYVIRAFTIGGRINPLTQCTQLKHVGRVKDQRFSAQYWFYRKN